MLRARTLEKLRSVVALPLLSNPFGVPKCEWAKAAPRIVKCELCRDCLAEGKEPACTDVCPRHAVILGKRSELLKEAKRRIAENDGRYVPKVYGETDTGGTQVLYLSHVPFEKLGLPAPGDEPAPQLARSIQHGVDRRVIVPRWAGHNALERGESQSCTARLFVRKNGLKIRRFRA